MSSQERLIAELGRAAFGEDRQRSFKSVVDFFERIGEERFATSTFLGFIMKNSALTEFLPVWNARAP